MITGEIKNQIDQIWDTFFVAGVTNPITVLEQMTYIFFHCCPVKILKYHLSSNSRNSVLDIQALI